MVYQLWCLVLKCVLCADYPVIKTLNICHHCIAQFLGNRYHVAISLLVLSIRSLPEAEEVRTRLDANSQSVMDKSALNDDQQDPSESSSGLNFCQKLLIIEIQPHALMLLTFCFIVQTNSLLLLLCSSILCCHIVAVCTTVCQSWMHTSHYKTLAYTTSSWFVILLCAFQLLWHISSIFAYIFTLAYLLL